MLLEDLSSEQNLLINEIIKHCQQLKCKKSLQQFVDGELCYIKPKKSYGNVGIYDSKKTVKPKDYPYLIHKEYDNLFKKYHNQQYMSNGELIHSGKSNGLNNECIVLIPDDTNVVVCDPIKALSKKNHTLKNRLSNHLSNKTSMDTFEVGKVMAKIDLYANNSQLRNEKDFSQAYAKVVDMVPDGHELVLKYYLKPLKTFMDDYIQQCPNGSVELFNEHNNGLVDCSNMVYINIKDIESIMTINELRQELKTKMGMVY